jgi:hypothetical protein
MRYFLLFVCAALIPLQVSATEITAGARALGHCSETEPSHAEIGNCMLKASEKAKRQLQKISASLHMKQRDFEAESKRIGSVQYEGLENSLSESEAAFRVYMDKECTRVAAGYGAGNAAGDAQAACEITLIDQRLKALGASMFSDGK